LREAGLVSINSFLDLLHVGFVHELLTGLASLLQLGRHFLVSQLGLLQFVFLLDDDFSEFLYLLSQEIEIVLQLD
jgi:hypothetical protein